jgi:hypothetical protein
MNGFTLPEIGQDIRDRFGITFAAECMFFLPASTLNFTVVPPHLRPSFLYCWELGWSALFSYIGFSDEPFSTTISTTASASTSSGSDSAVKATTDATAFTGTQVSVVHTTHNNNSNCLQHDNEFGVNVKVSRNNGEVAVWREKSTSFGQMSSLMPVMQINWR